MSGSLDDTLKNEGFPAGEYLEGDLIILIIN